MKPSSSSKSRKLLGFTFKLLGTVMVWIGTAILTKLQLAPTAKDWQSTLHQLPLWALLILVVIVPLAWLALEFIVTSFVEVRARVVEEAAPRFARWSTELPGSCLAVVGRWWDSCLACMGRWNFDGRYRKRIAEDCQQLHSQTGMLHATAGFSLEKAYVELNMAPTQYGEIEQGILASKIRGRETIYGFLRAQQPGTAVALLGRPGGGKTTLLRHLALLFSTNKQGQHRLRRRIPIVIELRRVTDLFVDKPSTPWKGPTLVQVVQHYWKHHPSLGSLMTKAPKGWLNRHLASGRVLIMVDGLDEVPHRRDPGEPDKLTARERVSQWLQEEMQREGQRNCLFILTSRPGGFAEAPLKQRTTVVEVQPLTLEQSEHFIYAFQFGCQRKAHPTQKVRWLEAEAEKSTEKLKQELRAKPHLADLRVNPLLLHMICLLHYLRGRLPSDRSDLYRETCDVLLNRDLRAPGIQERLRPEDKLAGLKPLADYFMRSQSPESKSTEELLSVIQPVFETLAFPIREFFEYVAQDSGLLQEVERGKWDFPHKTFYEYLAAEYWDRHPPSNSELQEWVEQDWWRVSLLFYSSKSEDSPVIAAALQNKSPKSWSLAFACLGAGHRVNANDRERANLELQAALSRPQDEDSFIPAAQALVDLRMRDVVPIGSDDSLLKRATLVSLAEYQLFVLASHPDQRCKLTPLHWNGYHFSGDPFSPALGVSFNQAVAFSKWAAEAGEYAWHLPAEGMTQVGVPDGCWTGGVVHHSSGGSVSWGMVDNGGNIRREIIAWGERNNLGLRRKDSWEILLSPGGVHLHLFRRNHLRSLIGTLEVMLAMVGSRRRRAGWDKLSRYPLSLGGAVLREVSTAFSFAYLDSSYAYEGMGFQYETEYRRQLVPFHAFEGGAASHVYAAEEYFKSALDSFGLTPHAESLLMVELKESRESERVPAPYAFCKLLFMVFAASADVARGSISNDIDEMGEEVLREVFDGVMKSHWARDRAEGANLFSKVSQVLLSRGSLRAHRRAWLQYALALIDLSSRDSDLENSVLSDFKDRLCVLNARVEGVLSPWEKILIVRSR